MAVECMEGLREATQDMKSVSVEPEQIPDQLSNVNQYFENWERRAEAERNEGQPRRKYDHSSIIWNYFYSKDRKHYRRGSRVFFEGDTLYSFGHHFPLAVKTVFGKYVINADKYSISTNGHQSIVIHTAPEGTPQIPFSALNRANVNPKNIDVIEKTEDIWEEKQVRDKNGDIKTVKVHHLGACLFRHGGTFYLSSLDHASRGRQFFLVQLKEGADSVEEAFKQISGLTDKEYEAYERGEIRRQGEYFFKPIEDFKGLLKRNGFKSVKELLEKRVNLGERINNGTQTRNRHIARDFIHTLLTGAFVRGTVRHSEHGMLKLGETWHEVHLNNVVNSWAANGRVD